MVKIVNKEVVYSDISNLFYALLQYELYLIATYGEEKGKQEFSQLSSAIRRHTLPGMGHPAPLSRRPTQQETESADAFLKTIDLAKLNQLLEYQQQAFELANATRQSRSVYKSKLRDFLEWAATQAWFPTQIEANKKRNYCPPMRHGYGRAGDKRTTNKAQLPSYSLAAVTEEEIQQLKEILNNPNRSQEQKNFAEEIAIRKKIDKEVSGLLDYWFQEKYSGRLEKPKKPTKKLKDGVESRIRRLLGWRYGVLKRQLIEDRISKEKAQRRKAVRKESDQGEFDAWEQKFQNLLDEFDESDEAEEFDEAAFLAQISPELLRHIHLEALKQTNLEALVPHPDTEGVTPESAATHVDTLICGVLKFMKEERNCESPYTLEGMIDAFDKIARFHWHTRAKDRRYGDIEVMVPIRRHYLDIAEVLKNHESVADESLKWLDMSEVLEEIVKPLRLECGYRLYNRCFRRIMAIAGSFQDFNVYGCLTLTPPRRQQEWREAKLANSCLLTDKPKDVKLGQFIHPLPRNREDETEKYFPYIHREQDGTWRLHNTQFSYKTGSTYGKQNIRILNPQFADGKCFYDYIEAFVYGYFRNRDGDWESGGKWLEAPNSSWQLFGLRMGADDRTLQGKLRSVSSTKGQGIQPKRFEPECVLERRKDSKGDYSFVQPTHFFFQPNTGNSYSDADFGRLIRDTAHRLTGQLLNPHLLRDIYATWFLNREDKGEGIDSRITSLAYAMAHSEAMLRKKYDKRTEEEKRLPIEEAMQEVFKEFLS